MGDQLTQEEVDSIRAEVSAAYDQLASQRRPGSPEIQAGDLRAAMHFADGHTDPQKVDDGGRLAAHRQHVRYEAGARGAMNQGAGIIDRVMAGAEAGAPSVMDSYADLPVYTGDKRLPTPEQMRPQNTAQMQKSMLTPEQLAALIEAKERE